MASMNQIVEKYMENLQKDAMYKAKEKPQLRPIQDRKKFWETVEEQETKPSTSFENGHVANVVDRKKFWESRKDSKTGFNSCKVIKTFQNKKVEDLTKTWQEIVEEDACKRHKEDFLSYYSRINVSEMSGNYEDSILEEQKKPKDHDLVRINAEKREKLQEKWDQVSSETEREFEKKLKLNKNETDVELLCKAIYENGEQYMDGTGAIAFASLKSHFAASSGGNLINAITKAKKFGIIDHDGDQAYALEADDVVVLQVPVFKVIEAFSEMRDRHPGLF